MGPLNSPPPPPFPPNVFSYGYSHRRGMTLSCTPHHFPLKGTLNTALFFVSRQQKLLKGAQNSTKVREVGGLLCNQVFIREVKLQGGC